MKRGEEGRRGNGETGRKTHFCFKGKEREGGREGEKKSPFGFCNEATTTFGPDIVIVIDVAIAMWHVR